MELCSNCSLIMLGERLPDRMVCGACERCGEMGRLVTFKNKPLEAPKVVYVPNFAQGDQAHPACEHGWLKKWNEDGNSAFVHFVRKSDGKVEETAKNCDKCDLRRATG